MHIVWVLNDNLQQQALSVFRKAFINIKGLPSSWTKGCLLDIADYLNGLAMQKFTTKEPAADMAEVAIKAVEAVFDWRAYLKEEFDLDIPYETEETENADS